MQDQRLLVQQARHRHLLRTGPDRVPDIDIDLGSQPSGVQPCVHSNPHAAVVLFTPNDLRSRRSSVELESVLDRDGGDPSDEVTDRVHFTFQIPCVHVQVARGSALAEGRKQHPALEYELVAMFGHRQPCQ